MKLNKQIFLFASLIALGVGSCSDDLPMNGDNGNEFAGMTPVKLQATVYLNDFEDMGLAKTRFNHTEPDTTDHWSVYPGSNFTDTDTVGIFARWGNMNLPTKDGHGGPLINIPMYFVAQQYGNTTAYTLENDQVEVLPSAMKTGNGLFMYYPYTPNMGDINNYPNWRQYVDVENVQTSSMYWGTGYSNGVNSGYAGTATDIFPAIPGLELRVNAPDGSVRCRDVLEMYNANTTDLTKGIISGAIYHVFSELIIMRGQGFDKPMRRENGQLVPDETITVVLDVPITHLRVVTYGDWVRWTTQLFYDENYIFNGQPMSVEEARKWEAWEGAMYPYTKGLPASQRKRAWYVMIPSIYHQNNSTSWENHTNRLYSSQFAKRPTVTEIQLYDNDGVLQHVTSFTLKYTDTATPTKAPQPSYRWPIQVEMSELGPTVRPVDISEWDNNRPDKDITDERTAGIGSPQEYEDWATAYNSFISSGRNNDDDLDKYGDLIDGIWHFYVSDWDFIGQTQPLATVNEMQDILEGDNQLFNVVWSNLNLTTPIFGKLTGHGGIKNIDFDHPVLNYTLDTDAVGIFAKAINVTYTSPSEMTFEKCNIRNGRVISNGAVGMLGGSVDFCRIANCEFTGDLLGDSTSDAGLAAKLFGVNPTLDLNISNTTTKIMFGAQ